MWRAVIACVLVATPAAADDWAIKRPPGDNARFAWDRIYGGLASPDAWWRAFDGKAVGPDDAGLGAYLLELARSQKIAIDLTADNAWLTRAAAAGSCRLVARLAELDAAGRLPLKLDWNARDGSGVTPLVHAIATHNTRCARTLLAVPAVAIDLAGADHIPPLGHVLVTRNDALLADVLARKPALDFVLQGQALDEWALRHDSWLAIEIVTRAIEVTGDKRSRRLLSYRFPPGPNAGLSLLQMAAMRDCSAIATELVALGADPGTVAAAPPVRPAAVGEADLTFLERDSAPQGAGPPVAIAAINGSWNTLAMFLAKRPELAGATVLGTPMLEYVIGTNEPAGIEMILRANASLSVAGFSSPLHWLASAWPDYSSRTLLRVAKPTLTRASGDTTETVRASARYREWLTWVTFERLAADPRPHGLDGDQAIAHLVELRSVYGEIARDGFERVARRRGATRLVALAWTTPEGYPVTLFDVAFERDDLATARRLVAAGYLPRVWASATLDLIRESGRVAWIDLVDNP